MLISLEKSEIFKGLSRVQFADFLEKRSAG